MDVTRVTSPPSILVNEFNGQHSSYRATSKSSMMPHPGIRAPMTIASSRVKPPPPPLPPPTHLEHLAAGSADPGWEMGNISGRGGFGKNGGSVSSESSLRGNWTRKRGDEVIAERPDYTRRGSPISTARSPLDVDTKYDLSRHQDEGYYSVSDTSSVNYQLHGARHLEQRNLQTYSQAYDNKLISRFGKPETPPRSLVTESIDASPTSSSPFYQSGKHQQPLKSLSMSDGSVSASPDFPFRKESLPSIFGGSPQSRPISPGLITSATSAKPYMDYRSPTWDGSTPSSATDSEHQQQQQQRRFGSQPVPGHERNRRSGSGPTMLANMDESAAGSFAGGTSNTSSSTRSTGHMGHISHSKHASHHPHAHTNHHPTHSGMTASAFRNVANSHSGSMSNKVGTNSSITSELFTSRHKRNSYDQSQSGYAGVDVDGLNGIGISGSSISDFPMEETGASALRQLHLEDHQDQPPLNSLDSIPSSSFCFSSNSNPLSSVSDSRLGMKRRASSPPPEAPHDDKNPSLLVGNPSSEHYQRNTTSSTAHLSANRSSPQNRFAPAHGSVSSASSSGLPNGSYASSNALSVGSSITSISSHERLSPGGISPSSEQHNSGRDSPYVSSLPLNPSPQDSLPRSQQRSIPETKPTAVIARKMSGQPSAQPKHSGAPKIQAHVHICECCPRKPKKFDTLQELKNHESEKQYMCQFCHNRFKNKNEAERHQNSLHLRRHSWSCATLAGTYDAAFHSQTAITPSNNPNDTSPPMNIIPPDICGYCGEEFSNDPSPDWDARIHHLTNVHKFGECNQSKKFFRADHFRQHLKHSHAGTSGKWTNMLENACMKDEPPITGPEGIASQGAPIVNMSIGPGRGMPMNAMNMGIQGMGIVKHERIDEMREEM